MLDSRMILGENFGIEGGGIGRVLKINVGRRRKIYIYTKNRVFIRVRRLEFPLTSPWVRDAFLSSSLLEAHRDGLDVGGSLD